MLSPSSISIQIIQSDLIKLLRPCSGYSKFPLALSGYHFDISWLKMQDRLQYHADSNVPQL